MMLYVSLFGTGHTWSQIMIHSLCVYKSLTSELQQRETALLSLTKYRFDIESSVLVSPSFALHIVPHLKVEYKHTKPSRGKPMV